MSTYKKAAKMLEKLYILRRVDFTLMTVGDIMAKAGLEDIGFYYQKIFWERCTYDI